MPLFPPDVVWPIPSFAGSSLSSFVTGCSGEKKRFESKGEGRVLAVAYVTNARRNYLARSVSDGGTHGGGQLMVRMQLPGTRCVSR